MAKINIDSTTVGVHRIYLPSTQDAPNEDDRVWLELKDSLSMSDKLEVISARTKGTQLVAGIASITTAWNYTVDGTPNSPMIPITQDLMDKVITDDKDCGFLIDEYFKVVTSSVGLSDEEKKTLLDTTQPSQTTQSETQI